MNLASLVVVGFHTDDSAWAGASCFMATDSTRRLHHQTPAWVDANAVFHIRIRVSPDADTPLTDARIAQVLLDSAAFYHRQGTWHCHLFLLMPDHLHALLAFPFDHDMRLIVGRWKAWQVRTAGMQENFFDHRIRNHQELQLKAQYIRQNPVVKRLCMTEHNWPWVISPKSK